MRGRVRASGILATALALILLTGSISGCASSGGALATLDELDSNETMPLFWRVEATRGATLFILGSVHLGPPLGWVFPPAIEQAFTNADALVVEVDPADLQTGMSQALIARYGMLPNGTHLEDRLAPETWAALQRHVANSSLPLHVVQRMQPWLVTNLLVLDATRRLGWSAHAGVDVSFIDRAGPRSVIPLESAEYQMALFARMPPGIQEMSLRDTVDRFEDVGDYLTELVDSWRVGDEASLEELIFESYNQDPDFEPLFDTLIFSRNQDMATRMKVLLDAEQHQGETVFVVIGVGHLIGQQGIPEILESLGYPVEKFDRQDLLRKPQSGGPVAAYP